jgi:Tol biopolymer transport system component
VGAETDEGDDIWVKRLPDGPLSRVSFDSAAEYRPRWMPDGRLMFASNRGARTADSIGGGLYARRADGTGQDSMIVRDSAGVYEGQWSPDGRWLVFRTGGVVSRAGGRDIVAIRPGVDSAPAPLIATRYDEQAIAIAPNGRWIAYESNETGRKEVFLRPFPATDDGKWQVSSGGGVAPLWSRDGRELFYVNPAREMVAVAVESAAEPQLGARQVLFRLDDRLYMSSTEFYTPYDVAPDGRFIMARQLDAPRDAIEGAPLIVVENWIEEVRAMMR